jgi:hypothetical protein
MGAIRTLSAKLRVHFILCFTQIWNHHPDNLALRSSLVRGDSLRVHLQRDSAVCVPQELLDRLHIFSVGLQQSAEGMPESMPADSLVNAVCFRNWPDMTLHEIVSSVRLLPFIVSLAKTQSSSGE